MAEAAKKRFSDALKAAANGPRLNNTKPPEQLKKSKIENSKVIGVFQSGKPAGPAARRAAVPQDRKMKIKRYISGFLANT